MAYPTPLFFTMDTTMQDYFEFLEDLRESGETNMFGAAPYLRREWPELSRTEAKDILMSWMRSYDSDS
jgi:hypothetical protein